VIDNSALPSLTENLGVSRKAEHYRRWQHFMRYLVTHGYSFAHLCGEDMDADSLTKASPTSPPSSSSELYS
jgi:hypothetical protein